MIQGISRCARHDNNLVTRDPPLEFLRPHTRPPPNRRFSIPNAHDKSHRDARARQR
jgi:hypothetical protein